MKIVKQLAIFLENQPGALLRVTKDLAKEDINILAISVSDTVDHAVVRMVVDEPTKALHMLGETGVLVIENDLLEIELTNKAGALTQLAEILSSIQQNMEYAYGSTVLGKDDGVIYIRVLEPQKVLEKLKEKL